MRVRSEELMHQLEDVRNRSWELMILLFGENVRLKSPSRRARHPTSHLMWAPLLFSYYPNTDSEEFENCKSNKFS